MKSASLLVIRLFLGITFAFYGLIKILGGQFNYKHFIFDSANLDGTMFVWSFYGYSAVYGRLIGLAELIAGLLLVIPRTRTLGALLVLPIAANITVMDFCFGFPAVKYFALLLTLLDLVLLVAERQKLQVLWRLALVEGSQFRHCAIDSFLEAQGTETGAGAEPVGASPGTARRPPGIKYSLIGVGGLLVGLLLAHFLIASLSDPVEAARQHCIEHGWRGDDLQVRRWIMTSGWSGFDRQGYVDFQVKGMGPENDLRVNLQRSHSFVGWKIVEQGQASR
jgi:hypothetical protein